MKKKIQNLLLLSLSMMVVFVFGEIAIRIFWKHSDNFFQNDSKIGRIHIPNKEGIFVDKEFSHKIKINSRGFMGRDYSLQKEEGRFRIIVLGDSMAEAMQVPTENSFCSLLESDLNQEGVKAEVINLGVSGFSTGRELLTLEHYGLQYQPNLVILMFTISNDIANNYTEDENNPSFVINEEPRLKNKIKSFLLREFRLVEYIKEKSYSSVPLRNFLVSIKVLGESKKAEKNVGFIDNIPNSYFIYAYDYPDFLNQGLEKTEYFLDKIKQMADNWGVKFLVVFLPAQEQLYEEIWQETQDTYLAMKEMEWDLEKPNKVLKTYLEENQIPCLDLYPLIRDFLSNAGRDLYYRYDGHLNKEGHQVVGQILKKHILNNYFK